MEIHDRWVRLATHIIDRSNPTRRVRGQTVCYHGKRNVAQVWILSYPNGLLRLNCFWPGHRFSIRFYGSYEAKGGDETFVAAHLMGLFDD